VLEHYLRFGGVEVANSARLSAYLQSVGSPLHTAEACGCPTLTAALVGDPAPYTTPAADPAPWWDPNVPESGEFAGLLVLSVDGLDDRPVARQVTTAVVGGAALGPARVQPRTIVVTAVLLGSSCCGVDYGLRWLSSVLGDGGCGRGRGCDGDDLVLYACCPAAPGTPAQFAARHRRTVRRVALVDGPTVVARAGDGCPAGGCQVGADMVTVEFTLTAATPWLWTDPAPVLAVGLPRDAGTPCVQWCVHPGPACPTCRLADCPDMTTACADPNCATLSPPSPPPPATCFCEPLAANRACYTFSRVARPVWTPDVPIITVSAGSSVLRRVKISFYERTPAQAGLTCTQLADASRCSPHSVYSVGYVPAGGTMRLDGQVGRATVQCAGMSESSPDVWGRDGAPPTWRPLDCPSYCVCVEVDALVNPAANATLSVSLSGRAS
jgi:hypothetical protein